jgi:Ras-related protein Rab-1A
MSRIHDYDYLFKCIFIGDSGIGKTSIIMKFAEDQYIDSRVSTIGVDFKIGTIVHNDKIIKLQIWDTAGQERFRTLTTFYYRGVHAIFICFDITNASSFSNLKTWYDEVKKYSLPDIKIIICGTKSDLESKRVITKERAQAFCDNYELSYYEISSKNNSNIRKIFIDTSTELISKSNITENMIRYGKSDKYMDLRDDVSTKKCCFF